MGIYDRDYYRREGHSFLGSFAERGMMCKWLVGINIACFVIQLLTYTPPHIVEVERDVLVRSENVSSFTRAFELNNNDVWHGQVWRLLTYAFLHDMHGLWHIFFNMLFLWWFGSDVEDLYGPREFLAIYLASAVAGGLVFLVSPFFNFGQSGACIGASGAVTAVIMLCAIHFPSRIVYVWFLPIPIWLFVAFSIAQDAFALLTRTAGGVAVGVHLGGAAFAFAYYRLHWHLLSLVPNFTGWRRRLTGPRLRVYRETAAPRPAPVGVTAAPPPVQQQAQAQPDDEQLEAKMDAVLEKISRVGKENLTESDREVLRRAAERFKRRRT